METETIETETGLTRILKESNLELSEAETIKQSYLPYFEQMAVIKMEAQKIDFNAPTQTDELIARNLRLRTVKIRTGSETIKDERKRIHALKANVEQSAWNLIRDTCKLDEERFLQVEKQREIEETKRRAQLQIERNAELVQYGIDTTFYKTGDMPDDVWASLIENTKVSYQAKKDAEILAENLRVEKEKKEKAEQEAIRLENEHLKKEAEAKEKALAAERAKVESERKAAEEKALKERQAIEVKAKAEREKAQRESEAKLKVEQESKEKIEAVLKAKMEAEAQAKREAEEKAEAELSKGDKDKMKDFIFELENLTTKYSFKSKKYLTAYKVSNEYIFKLINNLKTAK